KACLGEVPDEVRARTHRDCVPPHLGALRQAGAQRHFRRHRATPPPGRAGTLGGPSALAAGLSVQRRRSLVSPTRVHDGGDDEQHRRVAAWRHRRRGWAWVRLRGNDPQPGRALGAAELPPQQGWRAALLGGQPA
ncbi:unnamed protein product, partial [Prorocentrum cordatum]